jgi:Ca2+-binding RTX toxin-like protein
VNYNLSTRGQLLTTLANGTQVQGFERLEFFGGAGADTVTGAALQDSLNGGLGNDVLNGLGGHDDLEGGEGADKLFGGAGNDEFWDYDSRGMGRSDTASGGIGNDVFRDGYGADVMNGDAGADVFYLGAWPRNEDYLADTVNGGAGWDAVSYDGAGASVHVDLLNQATNAGVARGDRFTGVEELIGSSHDDSLFGDNNDNRLYGGQEDDVLMGRGGNDMLVGGSGADELWGNAGADTFVLEHDDSYLGYDRIWPHDTIKDFDKAADKLRVVENDFGVDATNFRLLNQLTNTVAGVSGPTFVFETDASRLWFDADGRGRDTDGDGQIDTNVDAVLVVTLSGVTSLGAGNFSFSDF